MRTKIRCKLSAEGLAEMTRSQIGSKMGYILRETRDGECFIVIWDGYKTGMSIGKDFIETVKEISNCVDHKKSIAGITDMKLLAKMVGDLHYETLTEFLNRLAEKFFNDYNNDKEAGRTELANCLLWTYYGIHKASYGAERAWRVSKLFMLTNDPNVQECDATESQSGN